MIRLATDADLADLLVVYNHAIEHTTGGSALIVVFCHTAHIRHSLVPCTETRRTPTK
jgi:hypothetical protein